MVRVELNKISKSLPAGGDALTAAHYADLRLRIKEALNPTRPVVNMNMSMMMGRGLNDNTASQDNNCWPATTW